LIDVLDAAYSLDTSDEEWLDGVATLAAGSFPGVLGGVAYSYGSLFRPADPLAVGGASGLRHIPRTVHSEIHHDVLRAVYGSRPKSGPSRAYFRAAGQPWPATIRRMYRGLAIADMFAVTVPQPTRTSLTLGLALDPMAYPDIEEHDWRHLVDVWDVVALHLDQAASLRRELRDERAVVDARLDHRGHGEHSALAAPWRAVITAAVLSCERARDPRHTPVAPDVWQWGNLLAGLWSVVRRRAESGRIEYLAIRNPTSVLRRLTQFERRVVEHAAAGDANKHIAGELGVHESSVSRALHRALQKLGTRNRADLILLYTALSR
jgi:DNA-binding CsgD family transcriptional regulator